MQKCSQNNENSAHPQRSFFGRRQGRTLSPSLAAIVEELLPQVQIPPSVISETQTLLPARLFSEKYKNFSLEIGFGCGERLVRHAHREPSTGFLGAEPYINGVAALLKDLKANPAFNIRIFTGDGMQLADSLTDECLDSVYVLNPDPWHKKRHNKRRIINQDNLDIFARILKPSGKLFMSTDVEDLAEWMVSQAIRHPAFYWTAQRATDWKNPPENWITTRYEQKRAKGATRMTYLIFEKRDTLCAS